MRQLTFLHKVVLSLFYSFNRKSFHVKILVLVTKVPEISFSLLVVFNLSVFVQNFELYRKCSDCGAPICLVCTKARIFNFQIDFSAILAIRALNFDCTESFTILLSSKLMPTNTAWFWNLPKVGLVSAVVVLGNFCSGLHRVYCS